MILCKFVFNALIRHIVFMLFLIAGPSLLAALFWGISKPLLDLLQLNNAEIVFNFILTNIFLITIPISRIILEKNMLGSTFKNIIYTSVCSIISLIPAFLFYASATGSNSDSPDPTPIIHGNLILPFQVSFIFSFLCGVLLFFFWPVLQNRVFKLLSK